MSSCKRLPAVKTGSVLIDALMGVAIFSFYFTIVISVLLLSQQSQALNSQRYQSQLVAQNIFEAITAIADDDFSNVLVNGDFTPISNGGSFWSLHTYNSVVHDGYATFTTIGYNQVDIVMTVPWLDVNNKNQTIIHTASLYNWHSLPSSGGPGSVSVLATSPAANEDGTNGEYTFEIVGGNVSGSPITVTYSMTGSAIDGDDYTSLSGIIDIPIAATGVTLDLLITNDTDVESVESAILTIDALSGTSATINTSGSSATVTIADNDTTAAVTITATTSAADENGPVDGLFTVSIDGTNTTGGPLTIDYSTTGSATPGTGNDYATLSGTVDILDGSSSATIAVEVEDDSTPESSETVIVTLDSTSNTGYIIGTPDDAMVTIADDDAAFSAAASVTASISAADENGPVDGEFTVSLDSTNTTGSPIEITYSITGSATPGTGNDYATLSGTVDILDGSSSATIAVEVEDDSTSESSETVIVTITGGDAGISVGSPSSATVNIADDDSGGTGPGGGIGPGGGPGF